MVSATHATIVEESGSYRIRDLDSRRGIYVGSTKVSDATLRDGDELLIGPVRMRFEATRPPITITPANEAVANSMRGGSETLAAAPSLRQSSSAPTPRTTSWAAAAPACTANASSHAGRIRIDPDLIETPIMPARYR